MHEETSVEWLSRRERGWLIGLMALLVLFGALVEYRSAFLKRRMGDLGCYLRAGWAVRTGNDIYEVTFNSFHYNYPPLLAIFCAPLADPPEGVTTPGMLPYAASVAIWYVFSVVCLVLAVHWLAGALERTSARPEVRGQPRGCRRWWALRVLPVLLCLPPIGHTLMRGQVNLLVLALFCAALAAGLRGRRVLSGVALAGTICIKIYPAFLILYPLWRRDGRCLAGCALGLFLGLGVIPAVVFGPARTVACYEKLANVLIRPALGGGTDKSRALELTDVPATDSQSLLATLHNTLHPHPWYRPRQASTAVRLISYGIGGLLTLLTLLAAGWKQPQDGPASVIFFGCLVVVMLLLCPVCHLHYFAMALPLVMGLLASRWETLRAPRVGMGLLLVLGAFLAANVPPHFPRFQLLRDCGLAMYGTLLLWGAGVVFLWKRGRAGQAAAVPADEPLGMAA